MLGNHLSKSIMRLMRQSIPLDCNIQLTNTSTTSIDLDDYALSTLLLVIQEALMNCARHSHAKTVTCAIDSTETDVVIRIIDNGGGLPQGFRKKDGITKMEANVSKLNGKITLHNRSSLHNGPLDGTEVVISIPKPRNFAPYLVQPRQASSA